jgi:SAM-dependent methyltransferase
VLDLGCGAGDWAARIAEHNPLMEVVGVDVGADFIAAATDRNGSDRVHFQVEDFAAMSLDDASFDCVYADNSLEHAYDVDRTLAEVHRVLANGGVLVAAIPSDARNADVVCDNHAWKSAPHELRLRLTAAGFRAIAIDEVDTYRRLGAAPYPPGRDRMMYVTAWKLGSERPDEQRVGELVRWAYGTIDPDRSAESDDVRSILAGGHAWCAGYAVVLATALAREGFGVRFVSMVALGHPRGRGDAAKDTHEVVEATLPNGARHVVDAMAGVQFPWSIDQLLTDPGLADLPRDRDERYDDRGYDLYATSFWYERVRRVSVRRPGEDVLYEPVTEYLRGRAVSRAGLRRRAVAALSAARRWLRGELTTDPA